MILIKSAFWMVITVILCCCVCACITGIPPEGSPASGISVVDKTPRDEPGKIPLDLALGELEWYSPGGNYGNTGKTIHQIHGSGLDLQGNASSWLLGIRDGDMSYLLIYGQKGWHQVSWGEPFTSSNISFNTTILPIQLFEQNQEIIGDVMKKENVTECDIDLSDDIYTITVRSDVGIALVRFNSSTGELLSNVD